MLHASPRDYQEGRLNLTPNRDLLNVNFEGYKLSESPLVVLWRELPYAVSMATLKDEFSFQHIRTHTLHNHLHFDPQSPGHVYWCLKDGSVMRASCVGKDEIPIQTVFHLPMTNPAVERPTNVTIGFLGNNMGVVCAGDNEVTLFKRALVLEGTEEEWLALKSLPVSEDEAVIVMAARCSSSGNQIHVLCAVLTKPVFVAATRDSAVSVATYKWVRIDLKINPMLSQLRPEDVGGVTILGTFESKSLALYAAFQYGGLGGGVELLLISETTPILDSSDPETKNEALPPTSDTTERDAHLLSEPEHHSGLGYSREETHKWTQTETDMVVTFQLDSDVGKRDISCFIEPEALVVGLTDGTTLLRGELAHPVDPDASTWTIEGNILEVTLEKKVEGVVWKALIKGAERREEHLPLKEGMESELSPEELEKARKMLAEITGTENLEGSPSKKACRMVDPMLEECDSSDEDATLYIISEQCRLKQRIGFGGRQVVFTAAASHSDHPAYFSLRHDVDAVVWLPHASLPTGLSSSSSSLSSCGRWCHASTFNALGYVQASKRERKFTTCSPGLKYAVISDSTRHVFIYRQPVGGANSAAEHVYSTPKPTNILGLVAMDEGVVFVLTEHELTKLTIPDF